VKPSESLSARVPPFLLVFLELTMIHLNLTRPESLFYPIYRLVFAIYHEIQVSCSASKQLVAEMKRPETQSGLKRNQTPSPPVAGSIRSRDRH